jgi:tldD/pmbA family protein
MNIIEFKEKLFEKALKKGFESCEIYYSSNDSFKVSVYKGKIEKYQNRNSGGFGFRGIYNNRMGYFFSENIDENIIDAVIEGAIENSEILTSDEKEFIFEGSEKYSEVKVYDDSVNELSVEDKINMAINIEKAALKYNNKIKSVNTSMISTGEGTIYIVNTKGMELTEKSNYFMAYVEVMAQNGDSVKEKGEIYMASPKDFNADKVAESACKKALSALDGISIKSDKYNVIIKNETFADLLECFAGNFYAENVQKGFSLLKGKAGSKIANDNITIIDNPLLDYGYMTTAFDSEGVAGYSKNVVEKGILKTYLYNFKTANKDGVSSTGNGFKSNFKNAVQTSHTNFFIEKGNVSFDELLSKLNNGILITDVTGLHAGANSISGDFSLAAEGFKVENGEITTPVEQITIAGNFYEILNNITDLSDDLEFNTSAVGSPSVIIEDLDIAGL